MKIKIIAEVCIGIIITVAAVVAALAITGLVLYGLPQRGVLVLSSMFATALLVGTTARVMPWGFTVGIIATILAAGLVAFYAEIGSSPDWFTAVIFTLITGIWYFVGTAIVLPFSDFMLSYEDVVLFDND